ncbi:uncharacterized protein LOC111259657 [Varroa jacobsoni]|uniref:Uncharacterized protein n=1 Tax=Varroa destructor TaxID=109461 RepID=A0A7M7KVT8_VARDE|nr:uncharacterized protein LOC111254649 [Varroa destructor]XP_022687566.1 uncharacterized protein LOC111259657 [Varroa jacobsoni]
MMKLITLSLLLASLVAAAFGEADLKVSDAVKFAVAQAKTIKPSAVLVKDRGVTKPSSTERRYRVLLMIDGIPCEIEVIEKEVRIGFTRDTEPFKTVKNTAKNCVLCC